MRWRGRRGSTNVEDRRGMRVGKAGGLGCGGLIIALALSYALGVDPLAMLQLAEQVQAPSATTTGTATRGAPDDELGQFAAVVLADTEETWNSLFRQMGRPYREPTMVLFSQQVRSACGFQSAAVGPFYCPGDSKLYLDLSFFNELSRRMGAPGDFAQAYVIAHEIGHHVQNELGISEQTQRAKRGRSQAEANALSVRLELQADCLAGVWAHHANRDRNLLEPGDVEEGLRAASALGDDTLQKQAQGYTVPETWTHGSSEQRVAWLRRGMETGDPGSCDTFGT